jgi:hypothetical protein
MSAADPVAAEPRTESWPVDGPAEVELHIGAGSVRVDLSPGATALEVTVRTGRGGWRRGFADVLAALGGPQGEGSTDDALARQALEEITVDGSGERRRLVVRSPRSGPARSVPVEITVAAPSGSRVLVRSGSAPVRVTGTVSSLDVGTGSGSVSVGDVTAGAQVRTGSGDVHAGHLAGVGQVRTGSGHVAVDAVTGEIDVLTGSGSLRLGIAAGVLAELDVRSGSGRARSELPVLAEVEDPTAGTARVRARTGSGDVVVHAAPA